MSAHRSPCPAALHGRRVIELADERGVYCGKLFADMGADVIKIERPGGDATRAVPPFLGDRPGPDRSLFFLYHNTSKRGVTLDVTVPEGRALFGRLASGADLVIETHPPGYLDGLGIGYGALREINRRLVLTSVTGFGQTGPHRDYGSTDLVAMAVGGAMAVTGEAEDPPVALAGSQADVMASTIAAVGSLMALHHAAASGVGQHVDISAAETMAAVTHICGVGKWFDDGIVPQRMGTSLAPSVPSGAYRCRDGFVYLMVNRPAHWKALAEWIYEITGEAAVLDPMFEGPSSRRLRERDLLDVFIAELAARFAVGEFYHEAQRRHLAVTPINAAAAVATDRQLAARDYFVEISCPDGGTLRLPGAPYRHAATPWAIVRPAPGVGEHNEGVYCGELGLLPEELADLRARRVV